MEIDLTIKKPYGLFCRAFSLVTETRTFIISFVLFCTLTLRAQIDPDSIGIRSSMNIISSGRMDKNGDLWFAATGRGIYKFNYDSFSHFTMQDGLISNDVSCIYEDRSGVLWFGTDRGICRFDGKKFSEFSLPGSGGNATSEFIKKTNSVGSILQDKNGNYWFLTLENGVYRYDGKTFANFLSGEVLVCMAEDKAGNIWVGSWRHGGAYKFDGHTFSAVSGLSDNMIFCLYNDKEGNLWIGTRDYGVDRYDGKSITNFSLKEGLCNRNVSCIFEDQNGSIWLGSDVNWGTERGDACCFDGKTFKNITAKEALTIQEHLIYSVRTVVQDKYGNMWFGSRGGLLLKYDGKSFADFSDQVR